MALTPAQYQTLKADILANADTNTIPLTNAGNILIRDLYDAITNADLWNSSVSIDSVNNAVDISKYTPADAPDTSVVYTNRCLACQTKLMALQSYTLRNAALDATKSVIRAGLRDSVIQIPAGAGGALIASAGASGVTVLQACTRKASRYEKLFSTVNETTGTVTAFIPVLQGKISLDDIAYARELP